ncbi:MAG: acetyl-CoA carboxylase biotin carboxyl carrier protein subunit [Bacteroidales bacterium]|nr:acetyl-CoA carboxylase biotin carboxyl carrier protein subunit [Bacteroidales bacterium]
MSENTKNAAGSDKPLQKLNINGDEYLTTFTRKYENRKKWTPPNEKELVSFIPGTIRQVLIKEGDVVKANQPLIVLEAMKMMNTIYAPFDAKIKSVHMKTGDRLPKGTLMLVFE